MYHLCFIDNWLHDPIPKKLIFYATWDLLTETVISKININKAIRHAPGFKTFIWNELFILLHTFTGLVLSKQSC